MVLRSQLEQLQKLRSGEESRWEDLAGARVILPSGSIPWGVVHFVGGAVLGGFPELCYDALLRPLADDAGVAVVCTPYELGRDHDALSKKMSLDFEEAMAAGAAKYGWAIDRMPRVLLGHSLGAKLQVLARCRGANAIAVGLLAFNNFGVEDQVRLLRDTVASFRGGGFPGEDRLWEMLEPAIGRAARMSGVDFRPSPEELLAMVTSGYEETGKTRAWRFAEDPLDCSAELLGALGTEREASCSVLGGGHLAPVFISLQSIAERARERVPPGMADRFGGSFAAPAGTLGNEGDLKTLLESLTAWVRAAAF